MLADDYIRSVAGGFGAAVHRVMLRRGNHTVIFRIVALHACYKGNAHAGSQERIFAVSFLSTSPARIAKNVDVGSPEIQPFKDVAMAIAHALDVLDSSLGADCNCHPVNGVRIEGCSQANGFRELGGPISGYAMQGLAPPVVVRYVQSGNGPGLVDKLSDLLFHGHAMDQIGRPLLRR